MSWGSSWRWMDQWKVTPRKRLRARRYLLSTYLITCWPRPPVINWLDSYGWSLALSHPGLSGLWLDYDRLTRYGRFDCLWLTVNWPMVMSISVSLGGVKDAVSGRNTAPGSNPCCCCGHPSILEAAHIMLSPRYRGSWAGVSLPVTGGHWDAVGHGRTAAKDAGDVCSAYLNSN